MSTKRPVRKKERSELSKIKGEPTGDAAALESHSDEGEGADSASIELPVRQRNTDGSKVKAEPIGAALGNDSDEDDYMSEAMLQTLAPQPEVVTYSKQRGRTVRDQIARGYIVPPRQLERERREEGLAAEIGAENKGFQMLAKMGYKKGEGLGNPGLPESARQREPIEVVMRQRKSGLGLSPSPTSTAKDSSKRRRTPSPDTAVPEHLTTDFRFQKRLRLLEAKTRITLRKARRVCENLDAQAGVQRHMLWLQDETLDKNQEDQNDSSVKNKTTLETLIEKEEQGRQFEDEDYIAFETEEPDPFEELEPAVQLAAVTAYLREMYFYCIFCGARYQTPEELRELCPGETEEDHDED
ncbi:G patch domain-containing protein 11 [Geranomyces michiganensis]|nr:G patch domain-containing protein 11 [Geranomyces michiganensis]